MIRLVVIIVFCTLCLLPIAGFSSRVISNEVLHIAFTFGFGYVALPAMLLHLWPAQKSQSMEAALAAGDVTTTRRSAVKVVELEFDGEHSMFLAESSNGKTVCLAGTYLDGLIERRLFPALEFLTFANRTTGRVYGVEPAGEALDSWVVYGDFSGYVGGMIDGQQYEEPISELVAALGGSEVRVARRDSAA